MWNWFSPKGIVFGEGKAASTGLFARQWGRGRALVITGPFLRRSGVVEPVLQSLREEGLLGAVFSDIPSEPTDRHVREALGLFRRERCGTIVACGGGGPIDVAKAVSLLDANGGAVRDYAGVGRVPHPGVPIIAIPTTAGSGSEVSGTTIITEEAAHEKLLVISMYLVPEIAILDPLLTYGMPPALTAATGVDALTHAIESCVSRKATKLTIDFSLRAAGRLARFLPVAFASPDDAEARRECLLGSLEAGIAFTNSSVALVHGMARPLGAKFGIPHGVSNAVLLEAIMRFSLPGAPERYARLAEAMGAVPAGTPLETARAGLGIVSRLVRELHIPRLRDLLSREALDAQLDAMVREAVASGSPANNPRPASPEEIASLYGEAFRKAFPGAVQPRQGKGSLISSKRFPWGYTAKETVFFRQRSHHSVASGNAANRDSINVKSLKRWGWGLGRRNFLQKVSPPLPNISIQPARRIRRRKCARLRRHRRV